MMLRTRLFAVTMVVLGVGCFAFATPDQNATFTAPEIGSITIDGDISDWSASTPWSDPYIFWNCPDGGVRLDSTTVAKFAWSDADDMLYMAIRTNENSYEGPDPYLGGGHASVGYSKNPSSVPVTQIEAVQLGFTAADGNGVDIINEPTEYTSVYPELGYPTGGTDGVLAAQTFADGFWTYEIALPFWTDWTTMDTAQTLSYGEVVYLYSTMERYFNTAVGTNLTYNGNPVFYDGNWPEAAAITLAIQGDVDLNGEVALADFNTVVNNLGVAGGWTDGDVDGSGTVGLGDFNTVINHLGEGSQPAPVPEPATMSLLALSGLALIRRR